MPTAIPTAIPEIVPFESLVFVAVDPVELRESSDNEVEGGDVVKVVVSDDEDDSSMAMEVCKVGRPVLEVLVICAGGLVCCAALFDTIADVPDSVELRILEWESSPTGLETAEDTCEV